MCCVDEAGGVSIPWVAVYNSHCILDIKTKSIFGIEKEGRWNKEQQECG